MATPNGAPKGPPECPSCKIPMLLRTAAKGQHVGKQFWGCRQFPKCRCVINLSPNDTLPPVHTGPVPGPKSERHVSFLSLVAQRKKDMW
jgi:ssDNA-binding Zn-finger/Zn-ribbon topoisomerase 1